MSKAKVRVGIVGAGPIGGLGHRPFSHAAGYRGREAAEAVANDRIRWSQSPISTRSDSSSSAMNGRSSQNTAIPLPSTCTKRPASIS